MESKWIYIAVLVMACEMGARAIDETNPGNMTLGNITRDNCRRDRACFSTPPSCNPAVAGSCFFISTRGVNGSADNLTFEISGESDGYIGVGLSRDSKEGNGATVYTCANNNGNVRFIRASLNNSRLTPDNTFSPASVRGSVNGKKIQCVFVAPGPSTATRAANTGAFLILLTGNFTNGVLEAPDIRLTTNEVVELNNPNSTDVAITTPNRNVTGPNVTSPNGPGPNVTNNGPNNITTNDPINRDNCRKDRACFSTPPSCNPAVAGSCFFISTRGVNGNADNLTFEISGESDGYIGVGLSRDNKEGNGATVYSCANNNGNLKFIRATLNSGSLTPDNTFSPASVRGSVNGKNIQCVFVAPGPSTATRAANTGAFLILLTGNFTNGVLQAPVTRLTTNEAVALNNPNSTDTAVTTPNTNATAPNATAPNATAPNATAPNATAPNATAPNATAPNATAPNATAPNATAPNATNNGPAVPPNNITANDTINRDNCRRDRACFSTPPSCNPAVAGSCFFISTRGVNGNTDNLTFEISGETDGYIGVGLSRDSKEGNGATVYSCANNNGNLKFVRATLNSGSLTQDNAFSPASVRGSVNGKKIQCVFVAPGPSTATRAANTGAFLILLTGNFTNGVLGAPVTRLATNETVDLTNPNSTDTAVTTPNTNATTANNATANNATANNATANNATANNATANDNINRDNCRKDRACFSTPANCNPAVAGSCFFISTRGVNGSADNLTFEISGETDGYIGVGLSRDSKEGNGATVYTCANNNGNVKFIRASLNNSRLTQDNTFSPGSVRGSVNGKKIQCVFVAPGPSTATRAANTGAFLILLTGNFTNGTLGSPTARLTTNETVDLTNPNSTDVAVITPSTNTSTASNTTSSNSSTTTIKVTKENCKKDRACFSTPASCDPSTSSSCFFVSTRGVNGNSDNLTFEVSGESSGYIAVGLSPDKKEGDGDTVYVCANNNGVSKFIRATLNNSALTTDNTFTPGSFSGTVNSTKIQCIFVAPSLSSSTRAANTSVYLYFFTGTYTNGNLGSPVTRMYTNSSVDLSNINSSDAVVVTPSSTSTSSNALRHTAPQAVLAILLGVITLLLL